MANRAGIALETSALYQELKEKEKMVTLSLIAQEAAHEIRNPLNVIKIGLCLLKRRISDENIEKRLLQMDDALSRAASYIDDLLGLSRPPLLTQKLSDINWLIRESMMEVSIDLLGDVDVIEELEENLPKVTVDPDRMRQVITNIVKNALEAMNGKGRLIIKTSQKDGAVEISISDTGGGIKREDMGNIFDPFFTTKEKGTGLGLPIVKRIVDAHNGEIKVKSKEGRTTFVIKIPKR
jgi:two-component system sensor histidine kinase HydH